MGSDEEDIGDEGDMVNWIYFGCYVVILVIFRFFVLGFLLGLFLIEKKV